jgi:hypothetical protein
MLSTLSLKRDLPIFLVLAGLPLSEVVFAIAGGYGSVLPLVGAAAAVGTGLIFGLYGWSRRAPTAS